MKLFLIGAAVAAASMAAPGEAANMNGKYVVNTGSGVASNFNDDYASKGHEYFDVWAPELATEYAQVFWTSQGTLPLPDDVVKRFAGKVIAITGYEQDQVMVTPTGQPGVNPELDVSVPINWAYNHHYMVWMSGSDAEFVEVPSDGSRDAVAHGAKTKTVTRSKTGKNTGPNGAPTASMFSEGNGSFVTCRKGGGGGRSAIARRCFDRTPGACIMLSCSFAQLKRTPATLPSAALTGGESRKSFHGYPTGYAQLVESPSSWTITPMQV
jgi:hypothetical protein